MTWVPGLGRMHHPVRAALVLTPLLAVVWAVALTHMKVQRSNLVSMAIVLLCLIRRADMQTAAAWNVSVVPEGHESALWLAAQEEGAVVDLTGGGGAALGLQPIHQKPMLEGLRVRRRPSGQKTPLLRERVDGWLQGERQRDLPADLVKDGFRYVLVVDRGEANLAESHAALHADLGAQVYPGIYDLLQGSNP